VFLPERTIWTWNGPGVPLLLGAVVSVWLSVGLWGMLSWVTWWLLR
jgi:hypothetical protein